MSYLPQFPRLFYGRKEREYPPDCPKCGHPANDSFVEYHSDFQVGGIPVNERLDVTCRGCQYVREFATLDSDLTPSD